MGRKNLVFEQSRCQNTRETPKVSKTLAAAPSAGLQANPVFGSPTTGLWDCRFV